MSTQRCVVATVIGSLLIGFESTADQVSTPDTKSEKKVDLKVGDVAPMFVGTDESGSVWKLKDRHNKKFVVAYFYPADFTTGCRKREQRAIHDGRLAGLRIQLPLCFRQSTWSLNCQLQ